MIGGASPFTLIADKLERGFMDNILKSSFDQFAHSVGFNVTDSETDLMTAFALQESNEQGRINLGQKLGLQIKYEPLKEGEDPKKVTPKPIPPDLKGLQLIAQQRYPICN